MKWTSVEDELPKEGHRVLCTDGIDIEVMTYFGLYKGAQDWSSANCMTLDVLFWMPLPEPPKEILNE